MRRFFRSLTIGFAIIGALVTGVALIYGTLLLKHAFFFKAEIAENVYVVQQPFSETYDLRVKNERIKIKGAESEGWMIVGDYLYGSASSYPEYYILNLKTHELRRFESEIELDRYLHELELPDLNMSKQESVVHLKYGRGRNRLYPR